MGFPQRFEVVSSAMKAFAAIHRKCREQGYVEPTPTIANWPESRDVGVSSATIYYAFTGVNSYNDRKHGVPHDPDDFGRCYRLLKLRPDWLGALPTVAIKFPEWKPFVREWPKLTEMYEAALAGHPGSAEEMYEFMQKLRAET